jgi:hypothetical protein
MRKLLLIVATAGALSVTTAAPALAQIGPHEHFFTPPGQAEDQQIARGTGTCESNLTALNNFHENVHTNEDHPLFGSITADPLLPEECEA